jgi:hypothetical protein
MHFARTKPRMPSLLSWQKIILDMAESQSLENLVEGLGPTHIHGC